MRDADGAAAVESLRAEIAQDKEQARRSDAAASRAAEELEAERAAHCRSREEMAEMAVKLKDATVRNDVLEKERRHLNTEIMILGTPSLLTTYRVSGATIYTGRTFMCKTVKKVCRFYVPQTPPANS